MRDLTDIEKCVLIEALEIAEDQYLKTGRWRRRDLIRNLRSRLQTPRVVIAYGPNKDETEEVFKKLESNWRVKNLKKLIEDYEKNRENPGGFLDI